MRLLGRNAACHPSDNDRKLSFPIELGHCGRDNNHFAGANHTTLGSLDEVPRRKPELVTVELIRSTHDRPHFRNMVVIISACGANLTGIEDSCSELKIGRRPKPIISQAVVHGDVAYLAGVTPNPIAGDIKTQTAQVLRRVDELLRLAGTDKSRLLSAQVWIADMRLFEDHNSVWNEWVDPANPPVRACLTTEFWRPGMLVEVMVVAAVP